MDTRFANDRRDSAPPSAGSNRDRGNCLGRGGGQLGKKALAALLPLALMLGRAASGAAYVPASDAAVLAELPAGAHHSTLPAQALTATRLDIALPLAQFDISRARVTGDLRFLGYAEAILVPWMRRTPVDVRVLVLDATILQSRHAFDAALGELDRALQMNPGDAQAWLTRATVLRVLGRYNEALASCAHLAATADPSVASLCEQGLRGLTGHLSQAYAALVTEPQQALPPQERAWRYSELGEMAERMGHDDDAVRWFSVGLQAAPDDFYMRSACADVLLRQGRSAEALTLLAGHESMEPMLLRMAIAHRALNDGAGAAAEAQLSNAFQVEEQRGEAVHRREQARFLLDVDRQPAAALAAAQANWRVQREPDDALILLRAAQAAHQPQAKAEVLRFLAQTGLEDARLDPYRAST